MYKNGSIIYEKDRTYGYTPSHSGCVEKKYYALFFPCHNTSELTPTYLIAGAIPLLPSEAYKS